MRGIVLMKATLTALTIAATMFASSASAFDPDDLQKLKDTGFCVGCDLRKANLTGANLIGADLSGTDLRDAYLKGAFLSGANLEGADLSGAFLMDANLSGANLNGAALSYTTYMLGAILCNTTIPDGSIIYSGC